MRPRLPLVVVAVVVLTFALCASTSAVPPAGKVVRVGILTVLAPKFDPVANAWDRAFAEGLAEHGYVIGRNVVIEYRSATEPERLPQLAAELVALKVDVLVATVTAATLAAAEATKTIPIVMGGAYDPVPTGIIASLAHPGGNVTGLAVNATEISAKRVQLLREAVPHISRIAVLWNATFRSMTLGFQEIEQAAPTLGLSVQSIRVSGSADLDQAFPALARGGAGGLIVL
jgi:ABC-type uncharacterized transport system substrate-binding protein